MRVLLRLLQRKPRLVHANVSKNFFPRSGPLELQSRSANLSPLGQALAAKLVPYFSINHAVRGRLPGPYAKLPPSSELRRLALDVVATLFATYASYLSSISTQLSEAIDITVTGNHEESYWLDHKLMVSKHM